MIKVGIYMIECGRLGMGNVEGCLSVVYRSIISILGYLKCRLIMYYLTRWELNDAFPK